MTFTLILEAIGAIFSIYAAYSMSCSTKINTRPLYIAFICFFISNLALLTFFFLSGKVPIIIQMLLFFATSILGIYKHTKNKKRDFSLITFIVLIYLSLLFLNDVFNFESSNFEIVFIDLIASFIAILGSFLLSSHNYKLRAIAFICFFVADVIFVYIGYANQFYFFMIQSTFYLYTSIKGYKNTIRKEIVRK